MSWNWKKTLGTVAPALATAFGGPMAGVAVKIAGEALGLKGATEEEIAEAVSTGDPEVLLKLREANNTFNIEMKRLDVDIERINKEDRNSARGLAKAKGMQPQVILSTIYVVGFMALLWVVFGGGVELKTNEAQIANLLLGILAAGMTQVMNFWFGSSVGSKEKTEALRLSKPV